MKIILLGYGKMNRLIEQMASAQHHEVVGKFSRSIPLPPPSALQHFNDADVCIDFSHPDAVLHHLQLCINHHIPLIIGTTGWDHLVPTVQKMVENSGVGCLYSPNFSLGIHLFLQIVQHAAKLIAPFDEYDVCGTESHHKQKVDRPSGTAKALTKCLLDQIQRVNHIEFSSIRCGSIPGTHTIHFEGPIDAITLTHQAHNRQGFAFGALKAAEWIINKKGLYTLQDLLCHSS